MKAIRNIVCGLCVALMVWVFASWCDIIADNSKPNPVHSDYNFFVLLTENT